MTSTSTFRLHALHAGHGDCFWLEYGPLSAPHRIIIDCGVAGTFKALKAALDLTHGDAGSTELLVITHVDADHIAGALPLLQDEKYARRFRDIWFNGRRHLEPSLKLESYGPVQGERLTKSLLNQELPWNNAFEARGVSLKEDGSPIEVMLPGGAKLTILSPTWDKLRDMKDTWDSAVKEAGLDPDTLQPKPIASVKYEAFGGFDIDFLASRDFSEDDAKANGSSIAFLIEFQEKKMLFAADAHPAVLIDAIHAMTGGKALEVDVFKVPHHGSRANLSVELAQAVQCKTAIFSSNGAYFRHPDQEAVARMIRHAPAGVELVFNCRSKFNDMWDDEELKKKMNYSTRYGANNEGISVQVL